ncbi:MAG: hypothetical protein IPJ65_40630 [Archangiaceae bacterium]|nr:hypothetical protein [Archangiaceae bacterium]
MVVSRKDAKGYWLVIQREDGFVVQGANWSVAPGFDCAGPAAAVAWSTPSALAPTARSHEVTAAGSQACLRR